MHIFLPYSYTLVATLSRDSHLIVSSFHIHTLWSTNAGTPHQATSKIVWPIIPILHDGFFLVRRFWYIDSLKPLRALKCCTTNWSSRTLFKTISLTNKVIYGSTDPLPVDKISFKININNMHKQKKVNVCHPTLYLGKEVCCLRRGTVLSPFSRCSSRWANWCLNRSTPLGWGRLRIILG